MTIPEAAPSASEPDERVAPAASAHDSGARRLFELDFLRGVAILLVLGMHSPSERGESGVLRPLDLFFHQFGWSGVDLFFVLSGFLIGGLLFSEIKREGTIDARRFLIRRMFRIWPAYYTLLAYAFTLLAFSSGPAKAWSKTWPALVHLQNFIEGPRDQLWSLAVEEHFYLLLPLFLWVATRRRPGTRGVPAVPWTYAILAIASIGLRIAHFRADPNGFRFRTYLTLDSLFFGVLLAHLQAFRPHWLRALARQRGLVALSVALLLPAALFPGAVRETVGFTAVSWGYGLLLVRLVHREADGGWLDRFLGSRLARWTAIIGTSSYSIYLWHRDTLSWQAYEFTLAAGRRLGSPSAVTWALHTIAYCICAIVGGVLLGKLIETPALKLRDRFFPSRTGPTAVYRVAQRLEHFLPRDGSPVAEGDRIG